MGRFNKLTSWSYSVYTQYCKCPFSVCLDKIQRVRMPEEESPAIAKGNAVHDALERYVIAPRAPKLATALLRVPKVVEKLQQLRKDKATTEGELAFDKDYNQVDWRDWKAAWLRVKCDVINATTPPPLVNIVDWKTGKVHPEHRQQRSLYAMAALLLVKAGKLLGGDTKVKVVAEHLYTDTGQSATEEYVMKQLKPLQREWAMRTKEMLSDTTFPAVEGAHCRWCRFRKSNGGPCPKNQ